jgi:hypothetical protein
MPLLVEALSGKVYACAASTLVIVERDTPGAFALRSCADIAPRAHVPGDVQPACSLSGPASVWARIGRDWRACDLVTEG